MISERTCVNFKNVSVTYVPEGGNGDVTSVTDELGSRQRDQSTSSVTKRATGH